MSADYTVLGPTARRLLPVSGTFATLDIAGPASAGFDTVVQAVTEGPDGNLVTLAMVADSPAAAGITFDVTGTAIVCHFEDGVSTVADFEAGIVADEDVAALIEVGTPSADDTYVLVVTDDDFAATALSGGGATSSDPPDVFDPSLGVDIPFCCDQALIGLDSVAGSAAMTASPVLWGFNFARQKWFRIGALNGGDAIAEIDTDKLSYAELVTGLRRFSRLYAENAVGGTATEVELVVDFIQADRVSH